MILHGVYFETPRASGAVGIVPAYGTWDINGAAPISRAFDVRVNVNDMTDKQYFTKRPTLYPGPGIWSSDGRHMTVSLAVRI